jgi:hypothetical protein
MITGRDVWIAREQRRDALALAERERLIRQIQGHQVRGRRSAIGERCCIWLAELGTHMVRWGERLQARYAQPSMSA